MAVNSKKNPTTYTYESVDGSTSTIEVGKDGVTKEMIVLLQQDDNRCYLQDLYQRINMSDMPTYKVVCPHCNHQIEVPLDFLLA